SLMAIVLRFHLGSPNSFWEFTILDKCVLLQLVSHFAIDVWKGKMNVWFPFLADPTNKFHWYIFGFDQYLHALIIICMIEMLTHLRQCFKPIVMQAKGRP